tara:strand:- start:2244 stop:2840 length:597 start_codon:yes stop_codon:yes gene_type:complete
LKKKINIFLDKKIKYFLRQLFYDYELFFFNISEVQKNFENTYTNIIFLNDNESTSSIDFKKLRNNFIILSDIKNHNLNTNNQLIKIPASINQIKTITENFLENLKISFHDVTIVNEKMTNVNNNSFCYLTKLEAEILSYLIIEKKSTKKYIQENILSIKSTIQTSSLDSHLTRIRKKINLINSNIKIHSKSEKLLVTI